MKFQRSQSQPLSKLNIIIFLCCFVTSIIAYNSSLTEENISGAPRELKVTIFEDKKYVKDKSDHGIIKLNISWLPPATLWNPTSYSILINSIEELDTEDSIICPDESIFHTIWDKSHLNIQLPSNEIFTDIPELTIRPRCTYEIQVFANPRINANSNVVKVNITIPNCIGSLCNCEDAVKFLSLPKVNVELLDSDDILIEWSVQDSINSINITSYAISYAVPILISKNGFLIYNTTEIARVPANVSHYLLSTGLINPSIKLNEKISVAAVDIHNCLGNSIEVMIKRSNQTDKFKLAKQSQWSILIVTLVVICLLFIGIIAGYLWNRNFLKYKLINSQHKLSLQTICKIDDQRYNWIVSALKEQSSLYVPQEIEIDEFEISYSRLNITSELGKGQFAKVYLGYLDEPGDFPVAVKVPNTFNSINESEARQQLLDEIVTLKRAGSHKNLIKLIGHCTRPETPICIVLEYLEGGDLLSYLHRLRDKLNNNNQEYFIQSRNVKSNDIKIFSTALNWTQTTHDTFPFFFTNLTTISNKYANFIHQHVNVQCKSDITNALATSTSTSGEIENDRFIRFIIDIVNGMEYLEQRKIVHRDLAARNILISSNLTLKISDFGLARDNVYVIGQRGGGIRRLPIRWMAPETLRDRLFTSKSDVWSFGIVLWEIGTLGEFPYSEMSDDELMKYILETNGRLKRPNNISNEFYNLMQICWSSQSDKHATPEVRLVAPNYVKYNNTATLTCNHTVAPDDLHKIEFKKDGRKILEYIRDRKDPFRRSPTAGIDFEHTLDGKTIKLNAVHFEATGLYSCLASSDHPIYTESSEEVKLQVIVPQSDNPHITFKKDVYTVGEVLEANCTSSAAYPVPHLTWLINGKEVDETLVTTFPYRKHQKNLMSATSKLAIRVSDLHAGDNGELEIRCQATIPNFLNHHKTYADIRKKTVTVEIIHAPAPTSSFADLPREFKILTIVCTICAMHKFFH
ncbi:hypothetical protein PV327_004642 [Microctonus hyperodae]|uniref:receptor protein-tyrosine kinase n=1 Tax=Microctonus hyperodae TaxID=165561 RepID=A0AA39KMQ9_MICHY|nr:hypothetical protein PV327_004642 [Microctonus hyperodae]